MRLALISGLALCLTSITSVVQAAPDCSTIVEGVKRLDCYDANARVAKTKPDAKVQLAPLPKPDFTAYPATPYHGPVRMPDFTGRDAKHSMFRTRLRDGIRGGANFAGYLALIQFGCGTGCSVVYTADVRTGEVHEFPLGGEDAQALGLDFRVTSNLVQAQFEDVEHDACIVTQHRWNGRGFDQILRRKIGTLENCRQGDGT